MGVDQGRAAGLRWTIVSVGQLLSTRKQYAACLSSGCCRCCPLCCADGRRSVCGCNISFSDQYNRPTAVPCCGQSFSQSASRHRRTSPYSCIISLPCDRTIVDIPLRWPSRDRSLQQPANVLTSGSGRQEECTAAKKLAGGTCKFAQVPSRPRAELLHDRSNERIMYSGLLIIVMLNRRQKTMKREVCNRHTFES